MVANKTTLNQKKIKSAMLSKIKKYVFTSNLQYYSRAKYIKNGVIYTIYQSCEASSSFILHSQKSITTSHFSHIGVILYQHLLQSVLAHWSSSLFLGHQNSFVGQFIHHCSSFSFIGSFIGHGYHRCCPSGFINRVIHRFTQWASEDRC